MRKIISSVALVAGLMGAYALLDGAAAPPAKSPNTAAQAVRKAAVRNPMDALSQAQAHTAVAHRAALARDGKATANQLGRVMADLDAARPAVMRLNGPLAGDLTAIRNNVAGLKKRSGTDTGALVPEIAKVFKAVKKLQEQVAAYLPPEPQQQAGPTGSTGQAGQPRTGQAGQPRTGQAGQPNAAGQAAAPPPRR